MCPFFRGRSTGGGRAGGLVGDSNDGTITGSCATGNVTITGAGNYVYVGGLVGSSNNAITGSCATGNVTITGAGNYVYVGGLVGSNNGGAIIGSYAAGDVTATTETGSYVYVGGLVGNNGSAITDSYAIGNVTGTDNVGGLVGNNAGSSSAIKDCYAAGDVTGTGSKVGGLVGNNASNDSKITNSYATGNVRGKDNVGGLAGANYGTIISSYYNSETPGFENYTNIPDNSGYYIMPEPGTPKTMAEMKLLETYVDWDFTDIWAINAAVNNGYPYLLAIKHDYDMSAVTFEDKTVTYNGKAQSIFISGALPENVTVEYVGNGQTDVGAYTVTANFKTTAPDYNAPASLTAVLTIENAMSILSQDRIIPPVVQPDGETAVTAQTNVLSSGLTAGPNPVAKYSGVVNFFWQGNGTENGKLYIYDASGNLVKKINISDKSIGKSQRREIGKWDLKDAKGRAVSEGVYVVKGVIKTIDGKKEKISLVFGVR